MRRLATLLLPAAALAGCAAVGPDFAPPTSGLLETPLMARSGEAFAADEAPDHWWRLYADPDLDGYVVQALAANRDIAVAAANLRRARAALRETRALREPQTTATADGAFGQAADVDSHFAGDVTLDVAYEIDLFGRLGRAVEAARADTGAAAAALDVMRVSIAAETARAYVNACGAAAQADVARASLAVQDSAARLTRRQLEAGRGTGLDVARTQAFREQIAATIPVFEAERESAVVRLATLTGQAPASLPPRRFACRAVPGLARPIPVGGGAGLLRRRPDVRQAERELAAATARIGVATADLYPRIVFGGSLGANVLSDAGGPADGFRFGLGPLVSWSIPNLGVARARVRQAEASAAGALAAFDAVVLRALGETETALFRYGRELDRRDALARARAEARRAAGIARQRFQAGADSSFTVLDNDRALTEVEAALAQSDALVADLQITVFKALGGGWGQPGSTPETDHGAPPP